MVETQEQASPSPDRTPSAIGLAILTFLCMLPVTLVVPVLKGLIQDDYGAGDLGVSLFMSINMIAAVIFGPFSGYLGDKFPTRRQSIIILLLADALLLGALSLAGSWESLLALRFLEGAAHILALSILLGVCAELARRPGLLEGRLMGIIGAALTLGVAVGPPLGGYLGAKNPESVFRFGAVIAAAAAGVAAFVLRSLPPAEPHSPTNDFLILARERKRLLLPYAFAFCDRFTVGFFVTSFPLYLATVHGAQPGRIGLLLALFLLPFALLCYPAGKLIERMNARLTFLLLGSLLYGIATTQVGRVDLDRLPLLMIVLGVLSSVMFVPSLMLTARYAGAVRKASAMGGFNAAGSLGFLVGPLVAGLISTRLTRQTGDSHEGYAAAFEAAGSAEIACVLAVALFLLIRRSQAPAER